MSVKPQSMAPGEPEPRCKKCSDIPWNDVFTVCMQCSRQDCEKYYLEYQKGFSTVPKGPVASFEHHESFLQLEKSAENGCQLCRIIFMHLAHCFRNIKTWITGSLTVILYQRRLDYNFEGNYAHRHTPSIHLDLPSFGNRGVTLTSQSVNPDAHSLNRPEGYLSILNGTIELDKINKQLIQPWLCTCQQHHSSCQDTLQHAFVNYPTRLIWVGETSSDVVRLVEIGEKCPPYLILSYCWGKTNDSAKTTERNYEQRTKGIRTSTLPKTIRDAIHLTRAMGEDYIWIDALCIKQTDKGHTGDWATEASKVGDYYGNAKCLISASSATESEEGFLGESLAWRYQERYSVITDGTTLCKDEQIFFSLQAPEHDFWTDAYKEPITERGWCLQEWLLCPRRLHWTRNGLFWECNTVYISESEALSGKVTPKHDIPMHRLGAKRILQQEKEEALGKSWTALVRDYSRRKLTMESDRPVAIHGIATRLARQHDEIYCAGIFATHLVNGLMWHTQGQSNSTSQSQDSPSWSWTSVSGIVHWPREFNADQGPGCFINLVRFPPYILGPESTELSSRELVIKAPLIRVFLEEGARRMVDSWRYSYTRIETLESAGLWEELDLGYVGGRTELFYTNNPDVKPKPDSVLLAAILVQDVHLQVYGVILEKITVDNKEVYIRKGIFSLNDRITSQLKGGGTGAYLKLWQSELILI